MQYFLNMYFGFVWVGYNRNNWMIMNLDNWLAIDFTMIAVYDSLYYSAPKAIWSVSDTSDTIQYEKIVELC